MLSRLQSQNFYAKLIRTEKLETRLLLNSNFENYDIELYKLFKKSPNWNESALRIYESRLAR